ncbi:hypothetical protein ABW19_dt0202459 [Dactylella cylindrospora]|nr:hypothetical protein ABW19_dt0202459 [Dactylella cylindrospora]
MHFKFLDSNLKEALDEVRNYPFPFEDGFAYNGEKVSRFETDAVADHAELLINHFAKALDNIRKRAPLTYERAWYTHHEEPLILAAAERSERRLLAHVIRFTEAKYSLDIEFQQKLADKVSKQGRNRFAIEILMKRMPLPPIDIGILQYCHMLSSGCYQDDLWRNIGRLYTIDTVKYNDCMPLMDLAYPIKRTLEARKSRRKGGDSPRYAKHDLRELNQKYPLPDYLHWPEGEPLRGSNRLLDEIPERMLCIRCQQDMFFTKDKGEAWNCFLNRESVLCRNCGGSNSLLTFKWRYLRGDLLRHRFVMLYHQKETIPGYTPFPDMIGRHILGREGGMYSIDRILRHSLSEEDWNDIVGLLLMRDGDEEDWEELLALAQDIDKDLPSTNLRPDIIETDHQNFWEDLIRKYQTSINHITTADFEASLANLKTFADNVERLFEQEKPPGFESKEEKGQLRKIFEALKLMMRSETTSCHIPADSGLKYERFMRLKAQYPNRNFIPTIAIELVWRTHLLYPSYYHRWCLQMFNCWIEHTFDRVEDKSFNVMKARYDETAELWWKEYKEEYVPDSNNWTRFFSLENSYVNGSTPLSKRTGLTTSEEHERRRAKLQSGISDDQRSWFSWFCLHIPFFHDNTTKYPISKSPHAPSAELTETEQEELYHTLFDSNETRLAITTKLVFRRFVSQDSASALQAFPLEPYISENWKDEYNQILLIILNYPILNHWVSNQVATNIRAVDLLFTYDSIPITQEILFQPRSFNDGKDILSKRLLLWLCCRNHPDLSSHVLIPRFFRNLNNAGVLIYRAEISRADVACERAVQFLETHYMDIIERVTKKCEPLFESHIPNLEECIHPNDYMENKEGFYDESEDESSMSYPAFNPFFSDFSQKELKSVAKSRRGRNRDSRIPVVDGGLSRPDWRESYSMQSTKRESGCYADTTLNTDPECGERSSGGGEVYELSELNNKH